MSRITRAGALLGTSAVLAAAFSGVAHAAPKQEAKSTRCMVAVYMSKNFKHLPYCVRHSNYFIGQWNDAISSIKVEKACKVTLYRNANFTGPHTTWKKLKAHPSNSWRKDPDLSNNAVGDNKASSIKLSCSLH